MDLFELIFAGFILYLLYKLVFGLIVPVSRAASDMKSKMADFQRAQREQMHQQAPQPNTPRQQAKPAATTKPSKEDYLDFEEIK